MDARSIAEFLILDGRFPRSLAFCYSKIRSNLDSLAREYGCEMPSNALSRQSHELLVGGGMDAIFEDGLHEFIGDFIDRIHVLAGQVQTDFRFTE